MAQALPTPRLFDNTSDWFPINRAWQFAPPADIHGVMSPSEVEAASGHTFVATLTLGPALTLPTGAHVTMEVPSTWECHLGNPYPRGLKTVGSRDKSQIRRVGYGAFTDVECSRPDVQLALAASWGRHMDLVDVVVQAGELGPGDAVRIILGPPDGNLVQAQRYAQVAIFTVGVDREGNGTYSRAATHPTVRVVGAHAERFKVFAPAVVAPGEEFPIRVLPVDGYSYNAATGYRGEAHTIASDGLEVPASVVLDQTAAPTGAAISAQASSAGIHRVTVVDPVTGIAGKSNPIGAGFLPDRRVYFGEMHSQMWHSQGTGTTAEFFAWGRDVAGLDFCAPANHYKMRFEIVDDVWQEVVATANAFNAPHEFVTLVSHEWGTGNPNGHKNIYHRGDSAEFICSFGPGGMTPDELWAILEGRDALTIPHHTKFGNVTNWDYRNDAHQRLVEICSSWGISETGGPHSVQRALAMGHRLGFIGGTDSHHGLANQGSFFVDDGNGLACVMARELTRDAIWQALHERRCYATTGDRILLDFTLNGAPMGSDLAVDLAQYGARRFTMRVAGTYRIDSVELLRNNEAVFQARPATDVWEAEYTDTDPLPGLALAPTFPNDRPFAFYYLRVTQGNRQTAWASPIWLTSQSR